MPISQLVRSAVSGMVSHKLSLDVIANNLANTVTVDSSGTVRGERTQPDGTTRSVEIGQLQIATFTNPEGLESLGQTLFRQTANSGGATVGLPNSPGFGQVVSYTLEQSNV